MRHTRAFLVGVVMSMLLWELGPVPAQAAANGGTGSVASAGAPRPVNLGLLPQATLGAAGPARAYRPQNGMTDAEWEARSQLVGARAGAAGTGAPAAAAGPGPADSGAEARTPGATTAFFGLNEAGLTPSDMGVAVNQNFIVQTVNSRITVLNKGTGAAQSGFPKSLNQFFGLAANASSFDPRALYDWTNNRWIVVMIDEEFANPGDSRGFVDIAVSQTSNPTGLWNVYRIRMGGTNECPDFPTLGQDRQGIYVAANKFTCDANGFVSFTNAEVWLLPKTPMYAGQNITFWSQFGFSWNGVNVDTLQPANVQNLNDKPRAEFMVNSFNINFGDGQCFNGCSGLVVWAISNPFGFLSGGPSPEFTGVGVATQTYFLSFGAHEPGGDFAIDAGDTRISGSVVYSAGSLWASVTTGCVPVCGPQGSLEESSVIWWELQPILNDNNPRCAGPFLNQCPQITSAILRQQDCYFCGGGYTDNGSAYYATLQPDQENNVTMVFNFSRSTTFPGTAYVSRRVTQAPSTMHDAGIFLLAGSAFYGEGRWGDYTGTAVDLSAPGATKMWFAGMFVQANGLWGTVIGKNTFKNISEP